MAIVQDDVLALEDIQQRLGQQLKVNQEQIQDLQAELQEQNVKLAQAQVHAQTVRGEISQWQTQHRANELDTKRARQDLEHAKGSSLEASRMERLTAADSARQKSQHELAILTTALEKDTQEQGRLDEQAQALTAKLTDLAATRDELVATQGRLSHELRDSIMDIEAAALGKVGAEIVRLRMALEQAYSYYDQVLHKATARLQPWGKEQACLDWLAEYVRVDGDPPEVRAALAQVEQAREEVATVERQRAQTGADLDPTIVSAKMQVDTRLARVEALRQQHRQRQARELLKTSLV